MIKNIRKCMRAVYYYDSQLKHCPVKKYLAQFHSSPRLRSKQRNKNIKQLLAINSKINIVIAHQGMPVPPISYPLDRTYDYFEIKHRKNENILIRIFYFRYHDLIVLLNVLEKPANYDSGKDRRRISKCLEETQIFYQKFIANPYLYEEYS